MKTKKIIAFAVVFIIIATVGSALLYAGSWPPIYAVESESMEHSSAWTYGTINVGDLVFVKNIHDNSANVVTFIQGKETGYKTYGEYGSVILYNAPNGEIIIHRAMFYLSWNNGNAVVAGYTNQSWIKVTNSYVVIDNASYTGRNLIVYISDFQNQSGFVTVGDYNLATSPIYNATENAYVAADQNVFGYSPVNPHEILGVSFGQVPWIGLIKLNLMRISGGWPQYNQVPSNAYLFLGITIIAVFIAIFFPYERVFKGKNQPRDKRKQ